MIDRNEKRYQEFGSFLEGFIFHLNQLSAQGWGVLVEGKRDQSAMTALGYRGVVATVSSAKRSARRAFLGARKVVILTDLDREGSVLASRFVRQLSHEGFRTSLSERRRLKAASRGTFLHIENLSRFADVTAPPSAG